MLCSVYLYYKLAQGKSTKYSRVVAWKGNQSSFCVVAVIPGLPPSSARQVKERLPPLLNRLHSWSLVPLNHPQCNE